MKLPAIQKAALAACDSAKDGYHQFPEKCHFDPAVLLSKGADSLDCLTQPQVNSLKAYYAGTSLFPGYTMGDEDSWGSWVVGQGPGSGSWP